MAEPGKQELRRLAEAAHQIESWYEPGDFHDGGIAELELDVVSKADRDFIVGASPAGILSLLDELSSLERNKEETLQLIGMNIGESVAAFQKIKAEGRLTQMRLHDVAELCATVEQERDQLMAEVEALRAQLKQLNPAGHSLRDLLREDARRREFIDRMQAENERLRTLAAGDHEAARVAAGLPKFWPMLGLRCHFVAMVPAGDGEAVVVYRWWRRRHQAWEYGAKELWLLRYALGPKGRCVRA